MADDETLFPLELYVRGVPVSHQAHPPSRERWKGMVSAAARERQLQTYELGFIDDRALAVTIFYFCNAPMIGDIDNIVKLILDSLIGVAYLDDNVVERVVVQKFEPEAAWEFLSPSDQLAAALDAPAPVVYVRVDDDLSWRSH